MRYFQCPTAEAVGMLAAILPDEGRVITQARTVPQAVHVSSAAAAVLGRRLMTEVLGGGRYLVTVEDLDGERGAP